MTDATDDHGHTLLFQNGHTPDSSRSDDRDIAAPHSGFAQFLTGDGSVHSVGESIDFDLYDIPGTRAGRESTGEF